VAGVAPSSRAGTISPVSSRHNPVVGVYRTLARERGLDDQEPRLLLDGLHLLTEARAAGLAIESAAFAHRLLDTVEGQSLARSLAETGATVLAVSGSVLAAMSPVRTPSGVVAIASRPRSSVDFVLERAPQLVVLAADVQDAGNIGAVVRAAEAAGGTGLVACGTSADPFGWKALRGSMGSAFRLPIARGDLDAAIVACRTAGLQLLAAVRHGGRSPFDLDLRLPCALILGGEGHGLPDDVVARADTRVSIPMRAPVESLNVAVAAAVFVYEAYRQRSMATVRPAPRQ
jgi:TrmH family RNA methyltransferase